MPNLLQAVNNINPLAQTVVIAEDSVITSIGIFFAAIDTTLPITLELRPTLNTWSPSPNHRIGGSLVVATPSDITASGCVPSTTFSSATEYKFTLNEPVFVPAKSVLAICLHTSAPRNRYQVYTSKDLDYVLNAANSTEIYAPKTSISSGAFYSSSNGTVWQADQAKDLAFKVYRAVFQTDLNNVVKLKNNIPPRKSLTESGVLDDPKFYTFDPLIFTAGDSSVSVIHPAHGYQPGDKVELFTDNDLSFSANDTINGVLGSSILGVRTIDSADAWGYTFKMDSAATNSVRGGGTGLSATEQYNINLISAEIPYYSPQSTNAYITGNFTSGKSFGGTETAYQAKNNIRIPFWSPFEFQSPMVIADSNQEITQLSGRASTELNVNLTTTNQYVAPYIRIDDASLMVSQFLVDNWSSADSALSNSMTTLPFTSETSPDGGTVPAKHISIPYTLRYSSTSLVVLVEAFRPTGAEFSVWYRTNNQEDGENIYKKNWVEMSKTSVSKLGANYSEIPASDNPSDIKEYEFNVFDLPSFDQYQLKITMSASNQARPPALYNLRSITTY